MRLVEDLRLAVRHLRHAPGHAATAAVTLALAIGANSAIFSAVNAVLLRPLPVPDPGTLAVVWQTDAGGQAVVELTYRHQREWSGDGSIFTTSSVMASHNWSAVLEGRGEPSRIWFAGVSAGFFETLGVAPLLGRDAHAGGRRAEWPGRRGAEPRHLACAGLAAIRRWSARRCRSTASRWRSSASCRPASIFRAAPNSGPRACRSSSTGNPPNTGTLNTFGVFYVVGRSASRTRRGAGCARTSTRSRLDSIGDTWPAEMGRPRGRDAASSTTSSAPCDRRCWALWAAVACCC